MLPLLPAILLLLLQGSAGGDQAAWDARLPGALNALHRQLQGGPDGIRAADEVVFASLLAAGGDDDISKALIKLLTHLDEPSEQVSRPCVDREETPSVIPIPPSLGDPQSGYYDCRRSRDGPWIA